MLMDSFCHSWKCQSYIGGHNTKSSELILQIQFNLCSQSPGGSQTSGTPVVTRSHDYGIQYTSNTLTS